MGVPKFFRYISERYPCLSDMIQEHQVFEAAKKEKENKNIPIYVYNIIFAHIMFPFVSILHNINRLYVLTCFSLITNVNYEKNLHSSENIVMYTIYILIEYQYHDIRRNTFNNIIEINSIIYLMFSFSDTGI